MTGLDEAQIAVARTVFSLPEAKGFALAGGSALVAQGAVDRVTHDIDAFVAASAGTPPGDVRPLHGALVDRLVADGWAVTSDRILTTFARLVATRGADAVAVDLAVDSPPLFPVVQAVGLPMLSDRDLAARKVLAILDRVEGRDFTDLRALAVRYGRESCIAWARQLDDGVRSEHVAEAFAKLSRLGDGELPCSREEVIDVRDFFRAWSTELGDGQPS